MKKRALLLCAALLLALAGCAAPAEPTQSPEPTPDELPVFPLDPYPTPIAGAYDDQYYALREDGTLLMWGQGEHNGVGHGAVYSWQEPLEVARDVAAVYPAKYMLLYTDTAGTLWGTCVPQPEGAFATLLPSCAQPVVRLLEDVVWACPCTTFAYALRSDGTLWGWGNGMLTPGSAGRTDANLTKLMDEVIWVDANYLRGRLITTDHTLWAWDEQSTALERVRGGVVWASGNFFITGDGELYRFSRRAEDPDDSAWHFELLLTDVKRSAGNLPNALAVIRTDDSLWALEYRFESDGSYTLTPAEKYMDDAAGAASGESYTAILKTDGRILLYERCGEGALRELGCVPMYPDGDNG